MTDRRWFTAALALVVGLLLVQSLALPPASRLAPLWVLVPTAVLLLIQLLIDGSPRVRDRLQASSGKRLDDRDPRTAGRGPEEATGASPPAGRRTREARVVFWIAWLISLMYLVGFVLATALFLLPYLRRESGLGWRHSMVLSAVAAGVTYVVFGVVARATFPPGALF